MYKWPSWLSEEFEKKNHLKPGLSGGKILINALERAWKVFKHVQKTKMHYRQVNKELWVASQNDKAMLAESVSLGFNLWGELEYKTELGLIFP